MDQTLQVTPEVIEHPALDNDNHVVGNDDPTKHNDLSVVDKPKSLEPGYCGFTFASISTSHACNDCGKPAEGMLKKWDSGVLVWGRYACASCSNKHLQQYAVQISS